MWHEARKQEKKLREVMVNYQRRAERRREHYEKLRGDPTQLIRIYGTRCKLHIDPARKDEHSTMIPWQGDESNMISRYDVRMHMDYIPDYSKLPDYEPSKEEKKEDARCSYERYRSLVNYSFKQVGEKEALEAIDVEEMYPTIKGNKEKHKSQAKAAIAYRYSEEELGKEEQAKKDEEVLAAYLGEEVEEKAFSSESEYEVDIDIDEYQPGQIDRINLIALDFGVNAGAFSKNLRAEKIGMEEQKMARIADLGKSTLSGKKGRRERRNLKEQKVHTQLPTPPTYASRGSPTYEPYSPEEEKHRDSSSRSSSPEPVGKVEFITEFGGEPDTLAPTASQSNRKDSQRRDETRTKGLYRSCHRSSSSRSPSRRHSYGSSHRRKSTSRSRSRDRDHHYRPYRHPERSRSRDRRQRRRYSHSRSRSRSRERRYSRRSHSRSPRSYSRRSHSRSPRLHSRRSRSYTPTSHSRRSRSQSPKSHSRISHSRSKSRSKSRSRSPQEKKLNSTKKIPSNTQTPKTKEKKDKSKLTPAERLKKKMQAQLSKQFKQDKKVQRQKEEKKEVERVEREEDLRVQIRRMRGSDRDYRGRSRSRSGSPSTYYPDNY